MKKNLHFCNVLEPGAVRRLWTFHASGQEARLVAEHRSSPPEALPSRAISKTWRSLWQKKLNLAWLAPSDVFLRVLHLPVVDHNELISMVEFQLEKISPMPVAQIVWSIETLPASGPEQTVVVLLAARDQVEQFLGQLEAAGYLADRLEFPLLHPLLDSLPTEDGIWIYGQPESDRPLVLVAWWCGGALQNLQFLAVPPSDPRGNWLVDELNKMAWAGELEGWLAGPPPLHLAIDPEVAALWTPAFRQWSGQEPVLEKAPTKNDLAELSALRVILEQSQANLLPLEQSARYRQQFIDRLWMRGLGGVFLVYVFGVVVYFGLLEFWRFQQNQIEGRAAALSGSYTNAIQSKERVQVLQDQLNLKYAALDSLRIASEELPADLTLTSFEFSQDKVTLRGTAPTDATSQVLDFRDKLQKATVNAKPTFSNVETPRMDTRGNPPRLDWAMLCTLNLAKAE